MNTPPVEQLVEEFGVVPLLADNTRFDPEVLEMLGALDSISIPLTAIFPADRPNEPIVLRDLYTRSQLLEALRLAGPSRDVQQRTAGTQTAAGRGS